MCKIRTNGYSISGSKIKEALAEFLNEINSHFEIDQVILFGSYARGDYHENSDIDIIIIGSFQEQFFERIGKILDLAPRDLNIEPLVYTKEEFNKMQQNENPFILTVLSEGIALI